MALLPGAAARAQQVVDPPAVPRPDAVAGAATSPRPRIGLVLSGGGARGAAHIGVLKVLDELHIPIDVIAGTSMGAVVGGLYASGLSGDDIARVAGSLNWQDAFRDRPPRQQLSFRRKAEDESLLVNFPLGISGGHFRLPKGLLQGQSLEMLLRQLTLPVASISDFDRLPTPFRAVATDLATGDAVVMRSGDLATAVRASMSAPGVFVPVEHDGQVLVDGGIADNLPIDVARQMGVDVLIVVDVGAPLFSRDRLGSATTISNQMLSILIRRDAQRQLATLGPRDIVIQPAMGDLSSFDFGIVPRAEDAGVKAARGLAGQLRALALSPEDYARYVARRQADRSGLPRIRFVRVAPGSEMYAATIENLFGGFVGQALDEAALRHAITDFYGRGNLETLDYQVVTDGAQQGLLITAERNSLGANTVRFGMGLQDDLQGNATYDLGARVTMADVGSTGGEWVVDAQIGYSPHLYTDLYLPLRRLSPWFVDPHVGYGDDNRQIFDQKLNRLGVLHQGTFNAGLDFGREISNIGELRAGLYHEQGGTSVLVGQPQERTTFNGNGYFVRFSFDHLDDVRFPHDGTLGSLEWNGERYQTGAEEPFNRLLLNWLGAHSFGRETGLLWFSGGTTFNQANPDDVRTQFPLGGLFNLSGLPAGSLTGQDFAIARMLLYRKIGRGGDGPFDFPTYVGFSLEAGNVWQRLGDMSWSGTRKDASLFLGIDTFLGPVYLATGYDQRGRESFYLFLGRTFTSGGSGSVAEFGP